MDEMALQGLASLAMAPDAESQNKAVQFVEQLKQSTDGWKLCAQAFTSGLYHQNDHVKFFCLQVCEYVLKTRYGQANAEDKAAMKSFIIACLGMEASTATQSKTFLRNKLAQVMSLVFVWDFPQHWPDFFPDIMASLAQGPLAVDVYLRLLMAIDGEVVDRDIAHSPDESQRNTMLKDAMRERCVTQLADSWHQIMTTYEASQPALVCMCLEVVGRYVAWMDIGFFANDRMVGLILRFLGQPSLREAAADCVHDIISKGMEPVAKTQLIESFITVLDNAGIFKVNDDDTDFMCKLSKLINGCGLGLISSWQKQAKAGPSKAGEATAAALEAKLPYLLTFLGHLDDDVSTNVLEFATEYIAMLKGLPSMSAGQKKNIEGMLMTVIQKLKYDEDYNFEHEGEDEAEFQEYRKQARYIFNNIASLDSNLILVQVHQLVSSVLPQWETRDFRQVELAVYLLYSLGEALPASQGQHFNGNPDKASALQAMMRVLISSGVSRNSQVCVLHQFFETVVRYDRFFTCEPAHIPEVLMAFLDERGLRHPSIKVRSRVAYLFLRFVKSTKSHLTAYLDQVLGQMAELLVVATPQDPPALLCPADQLFLLETAATLVVHSALQPQKKQEMMSQLLTPIAGKFKAMLASLSQEADESAQEALAECLQHAMSLASRASKGFSGTTTMKQCGCVAAFTELLQVFLAALEETRQRASLQQGVRQYLHRMVVCLGEEVLPFLPEATERLLKAPDARQLYDFLPLINQVIMKFKESMVPFLSAVLMPLVVTVFSVLNAPADPADTQALEERRLLQRGYFLFLATLVPNCPDVLKAQETSNLMQVVRSVIHGAAELPDPQAQKSCFGILKKLVELWGGRAGVPGFPEFVYQEVVPACFLAPMAPAFDLNDGQTTLALGECAACMQEIYQQRGDEFIAFLRTDFFPSKGVSADNAQYYIASMQTNTKAFRAWLKSFYIQAKS